MRCAQFSFLRHTNTCCSVLTQGIWFPLYSYIYCCLPRPSLLATASPNVPFSFNRIKGYGQIWTFNASDGFLLFLVCWSLLQLLLLKVLISSHRPNLFVWAGSPKRNIPALITFACHCCCHLHCERWICSSLANGRKEAGVKAHRTWVHDFSCCYSGQTISSKNKSDFIFVWEEACLYLPIGNQEGGTGWNQSR